MLNLRKGWFDGETVVSRTGELESFLKKHLHKEAGEETESDFSRKAIQRHNALLELAQRMHDLPPLSEKWDDCFEIFEAKICGHVGNEICLSSYGEGSKSDDEQTKTGEKKEDS